MAGLELGDGEEDEWDSDGISSGSGSGGSAESIRGGVGGGSKFLRNMEGGR